MPRKPRCNQTPDLLDWQPPKITESIPNDRQRGQEITTRISLNISEQLRTHKEKGLARELVAARMSDWLGEDVSKNMVDAYASQSREDHNISLARALALVEATGDASFLGSELERLGFAVIPKKYVAAVNEAILQDQIETLSRAKKSQRRAWKGS